MRFPRLFCLVALLIVGASPAYEVSSRPFQYWDLSTGSHIAYVHYRAMPPVKQAPIVFLHGGPGAYLVDHPAVAENFYRSLAALGFETYIYDQIGSGHSARLTDPRQYTVDRHIRDLEAIRQQIGAEQMILVGDSWGATLGANYIAEHPTRCAKAIFGGPGSIQQEHIAVYDDAPMAQAANAWFASLFSQPRYREMADIQAADVLSVYRTIPDHEMDPQFDAFVQRTLPFLVCDPAKLPHDETMHGMGWWVNLMTSVDLGRRHTTTLNALSRTKIPVLVFRGGCDYLRWEVAYQYKIAFPNATLIYAPAAGHAFGFDQPELYTSAIQAFLLDRPLPVRPYTDTVAPAHVTPLAKFTN